MRPVTIARNYAETLYELGERGGRADLYGELLDAVAGALETTPAIADMLAAPIYALARTSCSSSTTRAASRSSTRAVSCDCPCRPRAANSFLIS